MSNKASDNLHRLIKSLSKPEKRYFKVYSSRHVIGDQNNYQMLFDAIDRQKEYDEEKLLRKFKEEAFVKRFSIAKSRLYTSILKSLGSYHANSSVEAQLKRQIHCAEILYNKSLYGQSLKLLKSARKVAEKHDKITTLIEIRRWEKRLMEKDNYEGLSGDELDNIREADQILSSKLALHDALWNVKSRIFSKLYVKGQVRSNTESEEFDAIVKELEMIVKDRELGINNEYLLNHTYSAYYYGLGDYKSCYPHLQKNLELIESNPHLFTEEPNIYLSVISNAIYLATTLGRKKEAFDLLEKLKQYTENLTEGGTEDRELRFFAISMSTELTLCIQSGEYDRGIALVPLVEEGLVKFEGKLSSVRKAMFYFNIAVLFFWKGEFNESLKWINQLLNNIEIDKSQDIHCMGQLLNLVIHLELGNKSLLPYTLRSTQRYLETRNKVFEFETVFVGFINDILKKRQQIPTRRLYQDLRDSLSQLSTNAFEKRVFEYFDYLKWAEIKCEEEVAEDAA